jgi:hypothetical protein
MSGSVLAVHVALRLRDAPKAYDPEKIRAVTRNKLIRLIIGSPLLR